MALDQTLLAGARPLLEIRAPVRSRPSGPRFTSAVVAPGRALMLLQLRAHLPGRGEVDLLFAPSLKDACARLNGRGDDAFGNAAFGFGGAILAPFANRIRGAFDAVTQTILADIGGRTVRLPANWGGKRPGAERYAMHGLILAMPVEELHPKPGPHDVSARGLIRAGDFGGHWLSSTDLTIAWRLTEASLALRVVARNVGGDRLPIGVGWHPWFAIPSGRRSDALLHVPARLRALVNNYDEALPTGHVADVAGTEYDFTHARRLGELYLDDCFLDLQRSPTGECRIEMIDPAANYGLRLVATSPQIKAVQIFADADKGDFVVIEPQFNLANPFGAEWAGRDTGMVWLSPHQSVAYDVRLELFTPEL